VPYFETKFLVPVSHLRALTGWLNSRYGSSDPFGQGTVESLYFDTWSASAFAQCARGDYVKQKHRLRGYDGRGYSQFQVKNKKGLEVDKELFQLETPMNENAIGLEDFGFLGNQRERVLTRLGSPLIPTMTVTYLRHRFRTKDLRFTVDEDIRFFARRQGAAYPRSSARLPFAVLEVKSDSCAKTIPECRQWNLEGTSFSKFYLGESLLRARTNSLSKYF
jgi:hypothetical protein